MRPLYSSFADELIKIASTGSIFVVPMPRIGDDDRPKTTYENVREGVFGTARGALTGGSVAGLVAGMRGKVVSPSSLKWGAGIGAAAGLADKLYQQRRASKAREDMEKAAMVVAKAKDAPSSSLKWTPGESKRSGNLTGRAGSKHHTKLPKAATVGKKGTLPSLNSISAPSDGNKK